jgi:SOS regulatory protein LexA
MGEEKRLIILTPMINLVHSALTRKQKDLLQRIGRFYQGRGYFPSTRELGELLKIKSPNTIFSHLQALVKKGYLKKNDKGKIIAVTEAANQFSPPSSLQPFSLLQGPASLAIPYFPAGVPAGFQAPAEDAGREMLTVDQYLIKNPTNTFALKVNGHSMEKAGIMAGDLILVEKRQDARPGQIIVAHLPSGFTVKRLIEEDGQKYLKAESSRQYQIRLEEGTEIWGVVIGTIRKY